MNITFEKIIKDYPKLYSNLSYLEIPEGQCSLVYELSSKLEPFANEEHYASQVKENFGGLRFYMDGFISKTEEKIIAAYEKKSYDVCIGCGWKGKMFKTLGVYCGLCLRTLKEKYPDIPAW
jgi:hypothetical protein